jgi:hypothetical protein
VSAGRELDALVAEKVMGWEALRVERESDGGVGSLVTYEVLCGDPPAGYAALSNAVPHYSTDIGAAWEVLGRFAAFMVISSWNGKVGCWAMVDARGPHMSRPDQHMAKGDAYPHAICLAALKAVGVEP